MLLQMTSYRSFLSEELARRIGSNPRYSQRAFARDLGLSPGELSELLTGKRKLTHKSARKIASALGLNPAETGHLQNLVESRRPVAEIPTRELSFDLFHVVSDWYCFGLLTLAELDGFRWDLRWIAERLGISTAEARLAIDRLKRAGLVVQDARGRLNVQPDYFVTPDGIPSEAVRNYHRQILRLAEKSLDFQAVEERQITGIGLAIDVRHVAAIKREIAEFMDHIVAKYTKGKKNVVYQLEAAFFRLSQGGQHGKV